MWNIVNESSYLMSWKLTNQVQFAANEMYISIEIWKQNKWILLYNISIEE
jgi:hypothetical protein